MSYIIVWLVMTGIIYDALRLSNVMWWHLELFPCAELYFSVCISSILMANELRRPKHKEYLREKALYPKVPENNLFNEPISSSVVFGKDKHTGKMVCAEPKHHTLIVGSTGSGKTACSLIPSILACASGSKQIVDIKSRELVYKTADIYDKKTMIIDLNRLDDYVWGWDIFYKLKRDGTDTEQDVLNVIQEVASIIIPKSTVGDPFWTEGGRNEFIGLALYQYIYEKNYEFIDVVSSIMTIPLLLHMEKALNTVPKDSLVAMYLNGLASASEPTLFAINLTMNQNLFQFANNDIVYFLRDNPKRANPKMLNVDGVTQYLCVDEHKLDAGYDKLFCIVMKQTLMELLSRTTTGAYPQTMLYYDEFQKLTESIPSLRETTASFLKTGRSKNTSLVLCWQNLDNVDKDIIYDMISNVHYLFLLSSNNSNSLTSEIVCKMSGTYYEKVHNYSEGHGTSLSTSFQEKSILKPEDLNNLGEDAVLIISNYGYFRTNKEATAYYKNEPFKTRYERIIAVNREVMKNV